MGKAAFFRHHEVLPVPSRWNEDERHFHMRLEQVLDDIYQRFGKIRERFTGIETDGVPKLKNKRIIAITGDATGSTQFDGSEDVQISTTVGGLAEKVDKEDGKGLSTNDYTTEEKEKLAGLAPDLTDRVGALETKTSGTLVKSNTTLFKIISVDKDNVSIAAGNRYTSDISFSAGSGYHGIAIKNLTLANASSSGSGAGYCRLYGYSCNTSGTCTARIANDGSSTAKILIHLQILCVRDDIHYQ